MIWETNMPETEKEYPPLPILEINTNYIEELFVTIYFNANRKNDSSAVQEFSILYRQLLQYLKEFISKEPIIVQKYVTLLYRLLGQTRDCYSHGKGEQLVSYMMIYEWYNTFPGLAFYAIQSFVTGKYSYGSWRDIKHFCDYVRIQSKNIHHPIIQYSIRLMNKTLHDDLLHYIDHFGDGEGSRNNANPIHMHYKKEKYTWVSKWIPREKKRFNWMYEHLVMDWFRYYNDDDNQHKKPISECKKMYRKIVSCISRRIETLEINLCDKTKYNIRPETIPQVAFMKYKSALFDIPPDNHENTFHQQNIAMHYYLKHFPNDLHCYGDYEPTTEKKYLVRVPIANYVKEAISIYKSMQRRSPSILSKRDLLNLQWKQFSDSLNIKKLHQFIPMIDMSETMVGDELYTAMGIACLIAERSTLGKKILVYDNQPTWVSLDHCNPGDFVSVIETLFSTTRHVTQTCCNINAAIQLLIDSFIESETKKSMIEKIKWVILSNQYSTFQPLLLQNMFKPKNLPSPIFVFWNMSSQHVFTHTTSVDTKGCFFFSGESIYPLVVLQKNHIAKPFQVIEQLALDERYNRMEEHCKDYFSFSNNI